MKILVTLKRTPHRDTRLKMTSDGALELEGVQFEVNPFDELAIEEALRIKEQGLATEVVVATVGGVESQEQLIAALAMGADRAVRVDVSDTLDALQIAKILAAIVKRESPALVLSGKLAIDDECGQVPLMLASLLGWPSASQASKIECAGNGSTARVSCEVDAGIETVELTLPALITADLRLNEPRYASLPGIMKAKKKPMEMLTMADCGEVGGPRHHVVNYSSLPTRASGQRVEDVETLAAALAARRPS